MKNIIINSIGFYESVFEKDPDFFTEDDKIDFKDLISTAREHGHVPSPVATDMIMKFQEELQLL